MMQRDTRAELRALHGHQTILVVDDNDTIRTAMRAILELSGFAVALAADGLDALGQLNELQPALIIFDLEMPHLDGFAFADELRRQGHHLGVPLLVVSGRDELELAARHVGAAGYLPKPFNALELEATVERLLAA
jgi:DNA-binding response OmpR family regulator